MRNLGLSYVLAIIGLFGLAGIHRFYLGKPVTGLIWLLTGGLFGIGTIYDLFTMQTQVDAANRSALAASQSAGALPAAPGYGQHVSHAYAYGPNAYVYPQQQGTYHAAGSYYYYGHGHAAAQPAATTQHTAHAWARTMPQPLPALELRILQLARNHEGRITAPLAAAELGVSIAQADEQLTEIAKAGHANVDVDADGVVVYDFPALRIA